MWAGLRRPTKPAPPTTRPTTTVPPPPSTVAPTTVTAAPEVALGPPPDQLITPKRAAAESAPVDLGLAVAGMGALAGAAVATAVIARRRLLGR